jgi:hypothetical protein
MAGLEKALGDSDPEVRDAAERALSVHQAEPPQSETKTREGQAVFLRCVNGEVVQSLPEVCLYCGQYATQVKRQVFSYQPAWGCLLDLITSWFYWYGTGTRKVTMTVPVCESHFRTLRRMQALRVGVFLAFIIPALAVLIPEWLGRSLSELLPGNSFRTVLLVWIGAWLLLLAWVAFVDRVSRGVRVVDIDDTGIWLEGVASEFSSAVTESADATD